MKAKIAEAAPLAGALASPRGKASIMEGFDVNIQHKPPTVKAANWLNAQIKRAEMVGGFGAVADLTPEIAAELLKRNPNNRRISRVNLNRMVDDIVNGRWQFNGESIVVALDGSLNDGQHRCNAVVAAGQPIQTMFVFGVSRDSRLTVDTGVARTVGHFLGMEGITNANCVAAAASIVRDLEAFGRVNTDANKRATKQEIMAFIEEHPGLVESASATPKTCSKIANRAVLAAAHFILCRVDRPYAEAFFARLIHGDGLAKNSPIYCAREYLMERHMRARSGDRSAKLSVNDKIAIIFRAWENVRSGTTQTRAQLPRNVPKVWR